MTDLRQAAQAVLERWDSPAWTWHDQSPTSNVIDALREALGRPEQTALEAERESAAELTRVYQEGYEHGVRNALAQPEPKTCLWLPEDDDTMPGTYRSACGELWSFIDGTWQENRVRFCHGCGGRVEADHGIKEGT